jgi:hypothetical protein
VTFRSALLALLSATSLLGSAVVVREHDARSARSLRRDELLYYPSGFFVRQASLGQEASAADLAWIRALQYYGEHKRTDRIFTYLDHIFRILTDLDPAFVNAYIFGGLVMAQDADMVAEGLRLLEKGVRANPGSWELTFETGFAHYVAANDYRKAAMYFTLAARHPDAPERVVRFGAFANRLAGRPDLSAALWRDLADRTGNPLLRDLARRRAQEAEQIWKARRPG